MESPLFGTTALCTLCAGEKTVAGANRPECSEYHGNGSVPAIDLVAVYGVGCRIETWEPRCAAHLTEGQDVFYCDDCEHDHTTHTSWEMHYAMTEDEDVLCLKCFAERRMAAPDFWITDPAEVTVERLQHVGHVIPELTGLSEPEKYRWSVETLDDSPEETTAKVREAVTAALKRYPRVAVVLSNAYQFSVTFTILVEPQ